MQANPRVHARAPHGPRPGTAREQEPEQYGNHTLYGKSDAKDARFVACPGKAEGRTEARQPPAPLAPPAAQFGSTADRPPPPPPQARPPAQKRPRRTDPPHGERTAPSQVGGNRTGPPPPPSKPNGARDRGRTRGGHRLHGTALLAPSTRTTRGARATPTRGRGGGRGRRGSASAHAHK